MAEAYVHRAEFHYPSPVFGIERQGACGGNDLSSHVLTDATVLTEQVSLFGGRNLVVSFDAGAQEPFEPVRERLRKHAGRIRT